MNRQTNVVFTIILLCAECFFALGVRAQSGGQFEITQSVIASGAGQNSTGGAAAIDGTLAQPLAGSNLRGGLFAVSGGFWNTPLATSAAGVSIGGRISTAEGFGIRNAVVSLTDGSTGVSLSTRSGAFGFYRFQGIAGGRVYILTVTTNRFTFAPNTRIVTVFDDLTDENFTALPE